MKKSAITLSQACDGLVRYKSATGMSPNTIRNYRTTFAKLQAYFKDDPPFAVITRGQLIEFFAWLRDEYLSEPDGAAPRGQIKLSPKTLLMTANSIKVLGKGQKERLVYFGKRTSKALWKLLTPRLKDAQPEALVLTVGPENDPRPMTRDVLRRLLVRIGERAGVANVYPHRFRHTFAITYLRNQGDLFTLQELLGHSDIGHSFYELSGCGCGTEKIEPETPTGYKLLLAQAAP